ncbi:MAG: hypothetical protein ACRDF4_02370 [Rhabdochlamydiaceae bacterium]
MSKQRESEEENIPFLWSNFVWCKSCDAVFTFEFAQSQGSMLSPITFPSHDFKRVSAKCPYCKETLDYTAHDWKANANTEGRTKEVITGLEQEIKALSSEKESLANKIIEQDIEIKRLRTNNDKLTEDNRILSHALEDYLTQKEHISNGESKQGL